jgi:hypothetical protein
LKKAGFTCKGEAIIYESMSTILPTCLGELTRKTAGITNAFPSVPTYGHWTSKGGTNGHDISKSLQSVRHTLENQQKAYFAKDWTGAGATKELLTKSFAQWTHFNTMMNALYNEFSARGSMADVWKLTCLIGKAFLEAVHLVPCVAAADVRSDLIMPARGDTYMVWVTLQAHRVLNEFILAKWRNDPRVAPIIVLHLLENCVGRCKLEKLEKRVVSQDALIAKMRKDMDKLTTSLGKQGKRKIHEDVADLE